MDLFTRRHVTQQDLYTTKTYLKKGEGEKMYEIYTKLGPLQFNKIHPEIVHFEDNGEEFLSITMKNFGVSVLDKYRTQPKALLRAIKRIIPLLNILWKHDLCHGDILSSESGFNFGNILVKTVNGKEVYKLIDFSPCTYTKEHCSCCVCYEQEQCNNAKRKNIVKLFGIEQERREKHQQRKRRSRLEYDSSDEEKQPSVRKLFYGSNVSF